MTVLITSAANIVGGEAEIPEDLLAEVVNLVEWPTAVVEPSIRNF